VTDAHQLPHLSRSYHLPVEAKLCTLTMLQLLLVVLALSLASGFATLCFHCRHLLPLHNPSKHVKLNFSPQELSLLDVAVILLAFVLRSIRSKIITFCRLGAGHDVYSHPFSERAEDVRLTMPFRVTQADFVAYDKALNGTAATWSNAHSLLFLSALTEPAMLLLLARSDCNVQPVGSVNVRNKIELIRSERCTPERLRALESAVLTATLQDLSVVRRGVEVVMSVSLTVRDTKSLEEITLFRQSFTFLQFTKVRHDHSKKTTVHEDTPIPPSASHIPLILRPEDPLLWARICKDYNPIHISTLAAHLFGFRGRIAHGNHVGALACPHFEGLSETKPLAMNIFFKRPIFLPAKMHLLLSESGKTGGKTPSTIFAILDRDRRCIEGDIGHMSPDGY
jgi:acyl dehydratase